MFDEKEIDVVNKVIWIGNSSYINIPKKKYKIKKNKYYKIKMFISEVN